MSIDLCYDSSQLKPKLPHIHILKKKEKVIKDRQKRHLDKIHKAT